MSTIIKLTSENVKRLQAVEITPSGNVVVIGGKNGAGKSSVLDSIEWTLAGDPSAKMPVRRGEEKSRTVIEIGEPGQPAELVVRRIFTAAGGTSLVVTNADGVKQMTPQAILDKLVGRLTFDPLAFARQKPAQQAETLRVLVGLDFSKHDAEHERIFNERTNVNRHVKNLEAQLTAMPKYDGLPEEEVSGADILEEQRKASETNAANKDTRGKLRQMEEFYEGTKKNITECDERIIELTKKLNEEREYRESLVKQESSAATRLSEWRDAVKALVDVPLGGFAEKLAAVEETNRKIRSNVQRADLVKALKGHRDNADALTTKLERMDSEKRAATTKAKYPVEGLLFDAAGGITLNGIPFEQCSAAEQLRVSVAVGFALNPKLRVLIVRDGSLLDEDSMTLIKSMAEEAKAQIWLERVETDAHTSVVIEDGHVQGVEPLVGVSETVQDAQPAVSEASGDNRKGQDNAPDSPHKESGDLPTSTSPAPVKKPSKLKRGQETLL